MNLKKTVWLLTVMAGITGAVIPPFSKIALESITPGTLVVLRYAYTFIVLVGITYALRRRISWRQVVSVLPVSTLAAVNAMCFAVAIGYVEAASAQLVYTIVPLVVVMFSLIFLHQKTNTGKVIGVLIGFVGVALVTIAPAFSGHGHLSFHPGATLLLFIGAASYALYTVLSKPAQEVATPTDMLLGTAIATVICQMMYSLATHSIVSVAGISARSLVASLIVGVIGTALTYWLYQYIVKISSPVLASVTLYVQPVFVALIAFLLLGEHLTSMVLLGGIIALVGVAQVNGIWNKLLARYSSRELES